MSKNLLWIAAVVIILMPVYFFIGVGNSSSEILEKEAVIPYDVEIITDDSALDPARVDIYTAFNSVADNSEVN